MSRTAVSALVVLVGGAIGAGCATAPAAPNYASATYHAAGRVAGVGAYAVQTTSVDLYHGAGRAIRAPLNDLNMMQEQISPVLLRAESSPYDLITVDSCNDVLNKVAELDLALGPDVDMPKPNHRARTLRGADFAADAALDAAGSAVEHFIPMRGTIKQISGATRYENHVKHAVLAGEVRRSFLKAVGMAHSCAWPAAPLSFRPLHIADAQLSWSGAAPQYAAATTTANLTAPIQVATNLSPLPLSINATSISVPPAATSSVDPAQSWRSPGSSFQTASAGPEGGKVIRTARFVSTPQRNAIPNGSVRLETAQNVSAQSSDGGLMKVSAPTTSSAAAPWSAGFAASH